MVAHSPSAHISLAPLTSSDLELLMAWRSHPDSYRFFREQTGPLVWEEHSTFWKNRKHREDFLILFKDESGSRKVGSLNVSRLDTEKPEVGIVVGEMTLRNKGIATKAVVLGLEWLKERNYHQVQANIHRDNIASRKLFSKLGFKTLDEDKKTEWLHYTCLL